MEPAEQGSIAAPGGAAGALPDFAGGGHAMVRRVLRQHGDSSQTRERDGQPGIHPQQGQRHGEEAGKGGQELRQLPHPHAAEAGIAGKLVQAGPDDPIRRPGARVGQAAGEQNDAPCAVLLVFPAKADRAAAYLIAEERGADQQGHARPDAQKDEFGALGREERQARERDRRVFGQGLDAEIDRAHGGELECDVGEPAADHWQHPPAGHAEEVPDQPARGARILGRTLHMLAELALWLAQKVAIDAD